MQLKLNFRRLLLICCCFVASVDANAQAPSQASCPVQTLSDRINSTVSPVTNFLSSIIFAKIPVLPGGDTAIATLSIDTAALSDRDELTVLVDDSAVHLEVDLDGVLCGDGTPAPPKAFSPTQLQEKLKAALPPSTTVTLENNNITITVAADAEASLQVSGDSIDAADFSDGSAGLPFIVVWLLIGAIFFTLRMGFINLRGFRQAIKIARGTYDNPSDPGEVTHFQALTAALSGTVGLGNIAGVAVAISVGGPGATFWMVLAGLLGMSSKFTECTLGVEYRKINAAGIVSGGPMHYLSDGLAEKGLGGLGRVLAVLFSILFIGGAFGAGNMFQVNQSAAQAMSTLVPLTGGENSPLAGSPWIIGLLYAVFVGLVIIGGIRSITKVTEKLVPLMAFIYLAGAITVIGMNISAVPGAFAAIISGAFTPLGVAGGFIGVLVQGLRRATFSNEAGVGSAAIAHAAVKTKEPVSEGFVALLEPFIDTVVICTITALVIIVTDMHLAGDDLDGITLTSTAFASAIDWFPYLLTVAVVLFAFSTSITWFYYGQRAFLYLVGDRPKADLAFKLSYLLVLIIGSSMTLGAVMDFADAMLLAMAFPNLIGLYILAPKVKAMLDQYLNRLESGDIVPYKPTQV